MPRTLRSVLNEANPNKTSSAMQSLPAGEAFNAGLTSAVTYPAVAGVVNPLTPMAIILTAWNATGGVPLTVITTGAVAGAGQASIMPNGTVTVDPACLSVELTYKASEGVIVTETIQIAASVGTFLAGKRAKIVTAATVVTGVAPGPKGVTVRAVAPAATKVALNGAGTGILCNAADVVAGTVTVSYVAWPTVSVAQALAGQSNL